MLHSSTSDLSTPAPSTSTSSRVIRGRVWKYGDDIDTDVIFPGRHTYTAQGREAIAAHALEDLDPRFAAEVQPGDLVVGGRNWGCGSSREQAVTTLLYNGVSVVLARSFGRIFYRNAVNQGLWALEAPDAIGSLTHGDLAEVDLDRGIVTVLESTDGRQGSTGSFQAPPADLRAIVEAGGLVPYVAANLPPESPEDERATGETL